MGMEAKPVVDLMLAAGSGVAEALVSAGYQDCGEAGVPGRRYFRLRGERDFNAHVVPEGGSIWSANLALREYLRSSAEAREEYTAAKRLAMARGGGRLLAYSAEKAAVLLRLAERASKGNRQPKGCV